MAWWEEPGRPSRGARLREAARIAAVAVAALAGGAGLLFLITQVLAPQPRVSLPAQGRSAAAASPTPSRSVPPLPTLPPVAVPAPPPTAADSTVPDRYLGDLTTDSGINSGEIDGADYRFVHGFEMSLGATTRQEFVVPAGYQSLTTTLKAAGGTIRFTLAVSGRTLLDRTLSPFQAPQTVTCATPPGSTIVLSGVFQGGGSLSDAAAIWGDARFSPSSAPAGDCS